MVYQKTNWTNGMVITSAGLNNLEDGVSSISSDNKTVVHKTGNETIVGDKTFTGNNSFNGIPVLAQSRTIEFDMWYGSKMKATRFGNLVTLNYSVSPSQDIPSNATSSQTIPSGFRPSFSIYMAQGAGSGGAIQINSDGTLQSKGGMSVSFPYSFTAVYFTNDVFPTS